MDMLGMCMSICHMCILCMFTVINNISVRLVFLVLGRVTLVWGL